RDRLGVRPRLRPRRRVAVVAENALGRDPRELADRLGRERPPVRVELLRKRTHAATLVDNRVGLCESSTPPPRPGSAQTASGTSRAVSRRRGSSSTAPKAPTSGTSTDASTS